MTRRGVYTLGLVMTIACKYTAIVCLLGVDECVSFCVCCAGLRMVASLDIGPDWIENDGYQAEWGMRMAGILTAI